MIKTCPVATVNAAPDRVWRLLAEPSNFDRWWDASTLSIVPPGPARAGQQIEAQTGGLGKQWKIHVTVEDIDETRRRIWLTSRLPLGITLHNELHCAGVDECTCLLSFG